MSASSAWWSKRYGVERECTCRRWQRSGECRERGWHVVDSHETADVARDDARHMMTVVRRIRYRVVDQQTGEVVP